jgi:hypothetical protein
MNDAVRDNRSVSEKSPPRRLHSVRFVPIKTQEVKTPAEKFKARYAWHG